MRLSLSVSLLLALPLADTAAAQCPEWSSKFGLPGVEGGIGVLHEHDDGSGPRLFAGGSLLRVGDVAAPLIASDGVTWSAVGGGLTGSVIMLVTHDDGSGPALYAGGTITHAGGVPVNGIARWDGASWSSLGTGLNGRAEAAATFDDGSGPALYVAGEFTFAGGVPAVRIARWDGATWSAVGSGFNGAVLALAGFDDGTGPKLYAAGFFTGLNGQAAARLARWDGTAWSAVAQGVSSTATCLAVHDDGHGPALYVGGYFHAMRWRAGTLEPVGPPGSPFMYGVEGLCEYDDGTGRDLYAVGVFGTYTGPPFRVARWDGTAWGNVGEGIGNAEGGDVVYAVATFDDGSGRRLVAGGDFGDAGTTAVQNIAAWDGASWSEFVPGAGLDAFGTALTVHDDGNGRELIVAGYFESAGTTHASRIASWNGSAYSALGAGLGPDGLAPTPRCVLSFDDGSGPALFVGGHFSTAGGNPAAGIARWSANAWSPLGAGVVGGTVHALKDYDAGTGTRLFAGGAFTETGGFTQAGGAPIPTIASWDGTSWSALGVGLVGDVNALEVFDAGTGPELYAGGQFRIGTGTQDERLAAWNGTSWRTVGFGVAHVWNDRIHTLASWHDGVREYLAAGGFFATAGGVFVNNVTLWDGSTWSALGPGLSHAVSALVPFATPSGPGLCAAGSESGNVERWDGATWSALASQAGPGIQSVRRLATYDAGDGQGPALYATGSFDEIDGRRSSCIAAYSECGIAGRVMCPGDDTGAACPCGNASAPGTGAGCVHSGGSAGTLRARGLASLSQDTLVLEGADMRNGFALYFQGTQRIAGGAGVAFGDGLRCAGGSTVRLEILQNVAGASRYPRPGDPPVATKGFVTAPGTRIYQIWFRDAASFCTSSTFNLTNAVEVVWQR